MKIVKIKTRAAPMIIQYISSPPDISVCLNIYLYKFNVKKNYILPVPILVKKEGRKKSTSVLDFPMRLLYKTHDL